MFCFFYSGYDIFEIRIIFVIYKKGKRSDDVNLVDIIYYRKNVCLIVEGK